MKCLTLACSDLSRVPSHGTLALCIYGDIYGKSNCTTDGASRLFFPSGSADDLSLEWQSVLDSVELVLMTSIHYDTQELPGVAWSFLAQKTAEDVLFLPPEDTCFACFLHLTDN